MLSDESGITRTHGHAPKCSRCYDTHDWGSRGRINVIGAIISNMLFTVGLFYCTVNSDVFGAW
ncbi:MAG: hypothetical protein PHC75_07815 [Burkholderiales bacterium]|nr:hypothetical protein [Burkholderiales bacterium]